MLDMVCIRAGCNRYRDLNPYLRIGEGVVPDNTCCYLIIRHRHDIRIQGDYSRAPRTNMDYIPKNIINKDTVTDFERLVRDDYCASEKIGKKVLGCQRYGDTQDACTGNEVENTYMRPMNQMIHLAIFLRISTIRSSSSVSVFSARAMP